jgi:predicted short-subunit dehydrogenase-like oxidoreductase (DUF2520 family)
MSKVPGDLLYTKSHEWVRQLPDGGLEIGITDHAQAELGDLVFVDVPLAGRAVKAGEAHAHRARRRRDQHGAHERRRVQRIRGRLSALIHALHPAHSR